MGFKFLRTKKFQDLILELNLDFYKNDEKLSYLHKKKF